MLTDNILGWRLSPQCSCMNLWLVALSYSGLVMINNNTPGRRRLPVTHLHHSKLGGDATTLTKELQAQGAFQVPTLLFE